MLQHGNSVVMWFWESESRKCSVIMLSEHGTDNATTETKCNRTFKGQHATC